MAVHKLITKPGIYFITFTCHEWLSLIDLTKGYDLVYSWFDILVSKGHAITGYVIMPNHLHMLLYFARARQSLNTIVGNGKRFIAYDMIKRMESQMKTSYWTSSKGPFRLRIKAGEKNMKYG